MAQPQQPGTHGGKQSPPPRRPFPLASTVRARDQWVDMCPWQLPWVTTPGNLVQPNSGLGCQVELQSSHLCLQALAFIFASYNSDRRRDQGSRSEAGKQNISLCKMNCLVVWGTSYHHSSHSLYMTGNCSIARNTIHPFLSGLNLTLGKDFAC